MRIRAICGAALLALITHCGSGGDGNRSADETSRLQSSGIYRPCGGGPRGTRNPFGLNSEQSESAEANRTFLLKTRARAEAMQAATGKPVRILFHQPGGWFSADEGGQRGAIPTVPVMNGRKENGTELYPFRWAVWTEELRKMASEHPDWVLGLYFSGQIPTADSLWVDSRQSWEIYDHEDPRHRELVLGVVDQWLAVGIREFIFDASSRPEEHPELAALAAEIHAKGARVFVEPHPRNDDLTLRLPAYDFLDGSLATHASVVTNEPESRGWIKPEGAIMMIALTNHESSSAPGRTPASANDVSEYRRRGFVLLSSSDVIDDLIIRLDD
jgi:hypothetical protein